MGSVDPVSFVVVTSGVLSPLPVVSPVVLATPPVLVAVSVEVVALVVGALVVGVGVGGEVVPAPEVLDESAVEGAPPAPMIGGIAGGLDPAVVSTEGGAGTLPTGSFSSGSEQAADSDKQAMSGSRGAD